MGHACLLLAAALAGQDAVFVAVLANDANALAAALSEDPDSLNRPGTGGRTPLMHAVLQGKATAVSHLLDAGADVSALLPSVHGGWGEIAGSHAGASSTHTSLRSRACAGHDFREGWLHPYPRRCSPWARADRLPPDRSRARPFRASRRRSHPYTPREPGGEQQHTDTVRVLLEAGICAPPCIPARGVTSIATATLSLARARGGGRYRRQRKPPTGRPPSKTTSGTPSPTTSYVRTGRCLIWAY